VQWFPAAVLFADISGFTPLTESLAQKGTEGPEELTRLLNNFFQRIIAIVESEGGEIAKFSGDALSIIVPAGDEPPGYAIRRAYQAASAMQQATAAFRTIATSVGTATLGMKIGIGAGEVVALHVGGVRDRWEYVIAGDPLRQVAEAESQCQRGEIRLSPEASARIYPTALVPNPLKLPDYAAVPDPEGLEAALNCYIPGVVRGWLGESTHDWLAVLRPMSVLFAGIGGLDYTDEHALARLHALVQLIQTIAYRYEGSLNKLVVDDKGTVLLVLFGAPPLSHQDDAWRAVQCALDFQSQLQEGGTNCSGLRVATGVSSGVVFAGPVGSTTRCEYTVMGDTVNLGARLMSQAGAGGILCDFETYRQAHNRLSFEALPPVRLKGKAGLIRVYRPSQEQTTEERVRSSQPSASFLCPLTSMVGRKAELEHVRNALESLQQGHAKSIIIQGEAGIGKSRLVGEVARLVQRMGLTGLLGAGQSIEQQTPYRAWRDIFLSFFGLEGIVDMAEREKQVSHVVKDFAPEQLERLPLLNDIINVAFPDTDLTAALEPSLRQQNLMLLLISLLRAWAQERPLILVIEDAHWLDSLSWELTIQSARTLMSAHVPWLLFLVTRPLDPHSLAAQSLATLVAMECTDTLQLSGLQPDEAVSLVTGCLGLPDGSLPGPVADLVSRWAGGNPFYAEELIFTLRDQGVIALEADPLTGESRCVVVGDLNQVIRSLPDTIQGLILARIDRLLPECQLTLKVASVIGRTFSYSILHDTLRQHTTIDDHALKTHLDILTTLDLTPLDVPEPDLTYIFKHIITQEVAYQTLLFAQRRVLHYTVAQWYETRFGDGSVSTAGSRKRSGAIVKQQFSNLAPYYPLLVYHYHQAGDYEQERVYARLAGEHAAAQFANAEAVTYLSRALELTPETKHAERYDLLMLREKVYDLQGARDVQHEDLMLLQTLAEALNDDHRRAEVALHLARYAQVTSNFPDVIAAAERAILIGQMSNDAHIQAEGFLAWGRVLWFQGAYQAAEARLERALNLALTAGVRHVEADILRTLGNVVSEQGDYVRSKAYYEQSLHLCRTIGDRRREGSALNNLGIGAFEQGMYNKARAYYEQYLHICRTIGDRWGETTLLLNLGHIFRNQGDFEQARAYYEQGLHLSHEIGDRRIRSMILSGLGLLWHFAGDNHTAREHSYQALVLAQETGDRYTQSYALNNLGHALADLESLDEAMGAYQQSYALRCDMGQPNMAMESLAGQARVAWAQGDWPQASAHVEKILNYLDTGTLNGADDPVRVYLSCYRVLQASGDERTVVLLQTACTMLEERASKIDHDQLRQSFLEAIPAHREVMQEMAWWMFFAEKPQKTSTG
jgi:class 3 adenylate cyclase/tetratricopeptide (TPR) repeat protein